ncbi:MAG: hypothetical protein HY399_07525 [Elusimicrobia bacterium]|nr:hypothetical protein [Elusimicrobiota bacterium]
MRNSKTHLSLGFMPKIVGPKKKNDLSRYAWIGILVVIAMVGWMSLPLLQKSSTDSSVAVPHRSKSRAVNLNTLGLSPEVGAPGSPLTGEMIDNPATAPDGSSSALYSGKKEGIYFSEEDLNSEKSASSNASATASGTTGSKAPSYMDVSNPVSRPKLSAMPSLSGGGAGTTAMGKIGGNTPFFGKGAGEAAIDPKSLFAANMGKPALDTGRSATMSNLISSERASQQAVMTPGDAAKSGATRGFEATKQDPALQKTGQQNFIGPAGLSYDGTVADLKKNDSSLSKKKIIPPPLPDPNANKDSNNWGLAILQMLAQAFLTHIFKGATG